jgi:hypothetical protein
MSIRYSILCLILLLSFSPFAQAQKKFLFDATKAETAGNADWVIDADQHNLGFSGGTAVAGNGSESNPQQFPTPDQSTVTSSTTETYWEGALSAWGIDLVKKGYEVETLPYNGKITYGDASNPQDLSNYNVFVVDEPNNSFSADEKTAILNFVKDGGGLCMISDHNNSDRNNSGIDSPHVWNALMQNNSVQNDPFGISFDYNYSDYTSSNIPDLPGDPMLHGQMGDVTEVAYFGATTMTLHPDDNSSVKGIVYTTGSAFGNDNVLVAYATFGKGKVFAMSDSSPAEDGTGDPKDKLYNGWTKDANGNHERLIMNASIWLANGTTTAVSKITATKDFPLFFTHSTGIEQLQTGFLTPETGYQFIVFNVQGSVVCTIKNVQSNHKYSLPQLSNGIYIYQLKNEQKLLKTGKFSF